MFSPEFDQVYREAFVSATGRDFSDEEVQTEYKVDSEQTVEALLERWTDPEFDSSPITDITESRRSKTFRIKHPDTYKFTEEDAADIAKVRFLGRQALNSAQLAIRQNHRIDPNDPERFHAERWWGAHPEEEFDEAVSYTPSAPSPQRLHEWPDGGYVNCLGIAIAAAAETESAGTEYVFMNRIRTAGYEAATDAVQILSRIEKICPEAFELDEMMHELDAKLAEDRGEDEKTIEGERRCIMDEDLYNYVLSMAHDLDTSFHHAVIRKDNETRKWRQFDPFGLIDTEINPVPLNLALSNDELLRQPGACNEVLLLSGDMQEISAKMMANAVDLAGISRKRLEKLVAECNSPAGVDRIRLEIEKARRSILFSFIVAEPSMGDLPDEVLLDQRVKPEKGNSVAIWMEIVHRAVENDQKAKDSYYRAIDDFMIKHKKAMELGEDISEAIHNTIAQNIYTSLRNNRQLQQEFEKTVLAMPFAYALRFAEERIRSTVFGGYSDKTIEAGDPAFQIGSMYLNHYARWREDGIVNVASELARINPSQLMWQSAVSQEGGVPTNDRVAAIGSFISSLRRGQKHPLVDLARHKE